MAEPERAPEYRKIEGLILRNDLATAEKLLKKTDLPEEQKGRLRDLASRQQVKRQKERAFLAKRMHSSPLFRRLEKLKATLFVCFLGLGCIVGPYNKMRSFTFYESWEGPPMEPIFIFEVLCFLIQLIVVTLCVIKVYEHHQNKLDHRAAARRSRNNKDERIPRNFRWRETSEWEKEKDWLIALGFAVLYTLLHLNMLVKMCR